MNLQNAKAPEALQRPEAENQNTGAPFWPIKRPTVKERISAALCRGERLTSLDAWQRYGTSRLGAIVFALKREGIPIASELVSVETSDGRTAHVARYWLRG